MTRIILLLFLLPYVNFAQHAYKLLEPYDFEQVLRKNKDGVLIDFRDVDSYINGHIRKSIVVDFLRDDFKEYFTAKYPKDSKIYLYAQAGESTLECAQYLHELGYQNLTVLNGGFEKWIKASRPYVSVSPSFKPLGFITPEEYSQMVRQSKWTLVVFQELHCPPCENLHYAELKALYPELAIQKIIISEQKNLAEKLNINKNPTLVLYKEGVQVWRESQDIKTSKIKENIY